MKHFYAAHSRHIVIQEDDVVFLFQGHFQTLFAAGSGVHPDLRLPQQLLHDKQIGGIVIHQQDLRLRSLKALMVGLSCAGVQKLPGIPAADDPVIHDLLIDLHMEGGAPAVDTADGHGPSQKLRQPLHDGKTQARALDIPVLLFVHSLECVKQMGDAFLFDPHPGVLHRVRHQGKAFTDPAAVDLEGNLSLFRVFHSVIQKIDQNLLESHFIGKQHRRQGGVHAHPETEPLLLCLDGDHVHDIVDHGAHFIGLHDDIHFPRSDLGHIQNIVDHGQKDLGGRLDISGILDDLPVLSLPEVHFIQADDGVDGGPDLMAHGGEEHILGPV